MGLLLGELSKHDEACPAGVLQGVTVLDISGNNIGDDGIAHLATVLQVSTTIKRLDIRGNCGIAVKGARSLGRALSVNSSLEELYISGTRIGDDGLAHIATALRTNNTLKSITFFHVDTCTAKDKGALSLVAALTAMQVMTLSWTSTHPDTTLKKMAECIKKSTLRILNLYIVIPQPLCEPRVSLEEAREWLQHVEVGGKEFILSLEDSRLESFSLVNFNLKSSLHDLKSQICMSLEEAATSVNKTRKMNYLPEIRFTILVL